MTDNDTAPPMNRAERRRQEREARKRRTRSHVIVALLPDSLPDAVPEPIREGYFCVSRPLAYLAADAACQRKTREDRAVFVRGDLAASADDAREDREDGSGGFGPWAIARIAAAFRDGVPATRADYGAKIDCAVFVLLRDFALAAEILAEAREATRRHDKAAIVLRVGPEGLRVRVFQDDGVTLRGALARDGWRTVIPDRHLAH